MLSSTYDYHSRERGTHRSRPMLQVVEMFLHRFGYQPGHEAIAAHCRRRYRLTSSTSNIAIDPSLWLVHYSASEPNYRVPVDRIPVPPQIQQMMRNRQYLQSQGRLVRKEFMLRDRNNWPTINLPPHSGPIAPYGTPGPMGNRAMPGPIHWQAPVASQSGRGPSPAKKARTSPYAMLPELDAAVLDGVDDEDTSLGDDFDHLTQRDVAMSRYKRNHEWMADVLSYPLSTRNITPNDRAWELLIRTTFQLPQDEEKAVTTTASDEGNDSSAADRTNVFFNQVQQCIIKTEAETKKLEKEHARTVKTFRHRCNIWRTAEERLRQAEWDSNNTWRLLSESAEGGSTEGDNNGSDQPPPPPPPPPVEKVMDVVADVEAQIGKRVYVTDEVVMTDSGGLDPSHPGFMRFQARYRTGRRDWPAVSSVAEVSTS